MSCSWVGQILWNEHNSKQSRFVRSDEWFKGLDIFNLLNKCLEPKTGAVGPASSDFKLTHLETKTAFGGFQDFSDEETASFLFHFFLFKQLVVEHRTRGFFNQSVGCIFFFYSKSTHFWAQQLNFRNKWRQKYLHVSLYLSSKRIHEECCRENESLSRMFKNLLEHLQAAWLHEVGLIAGKALCCWSPEEGNVGHTNRLKEKKRVTRLQRKRGLMAQRQITHLLVLYSWDKRLLGRCWHESITVKGAETQNYLFFSLILGNLGSFFC